MSKKKKVKVKPQVKPVEDEAWTGEAEITMIDLKDVGQVESILGNKQGDIAILKAMGMTVNEPKKNLNITLDK